MKKLIGAITGYLRLFIIGCLVIVLAAPIVRLAVTISSISSAEEYLIATKPEESLTRLARIERWSSQFPIIQYRLLCVAVRSRLCMTDVAGAEKHLRDIQNETYRTPRPSAGILETINRPVVILINLTLEYTGVYQAPNRWAGYEIVIDYLRGREEFARADAFVTELLNLDPANRFGLNTRDALARKRNIVKPPTGGVAVVPTIPPDQPPVTTTTQPPPEVPPTVTTVTTTTAIPVQAVVTNDNAVSQKNGKWAVVKRSETRAYDMKGAAAASVKAGTVIDVSEIKKAADGELAVCRIVEPPFATAPLYMRVVDLILIDGAYATVDPNEKALRIREATLTADITRLTASLTESHERGNPHLAEYERARTRYDNFWAKVKELSKKRDDSTGGERMRAIEQLRAMKGEDVVVAKALESVKKKYEEWFKAHPPPETSPAIEAIKSDLANVRQQISSLLKTP